MLQIHQKIEQARVSAGLSQEEMAEKLGIKRSTYQYWEKKTPKIESVRAVARVLGLPESYFLGVTTNQNQIKPPSGDEAVIAVLISRVAELLADKNGTSSVVESQKMKKDAESLRDMS